MYIFSFIIPVIAFIFESYPRFINRKVGVDIWTHLLYLKEYRKQKGIPNEIKDGFLVPGVYDYPPAFITILSKFPYKLVEDYEFLFSPFFDAIHLLLIFFMVLFLTDNIWLALCTQFLYAVTPIIVIENASATPRSLGYTLFTIVFMGMFLFQQTTEYSYLAIAIIAGSCIFLSHRFTAQGFLFFSVFYSVVYKNTIYVLVFLVSLLIAIIISKGMYIRVLRGHLGNLIFWRKNIEYRFYHQVNGSYKTHKTKDFVFRIYNQFLKFPPFVLAITNPWTLVAFLIMIVGHSENTIITNMIYWVLFSYILALVTIWVPQLRFLGEGQRYLELSAFPAAFLAARFLFTYQGTTLTPVFNGIYLVGIVACIITIIVIQRKAIIKDRLRTLTPSMEQMFLYLKAYKKKPKLLCIPHQITTSTIYHTGCSVFVNADYTNIIKISDVYPFIKKPIAKIMKEYKLDMILMNEEYASINDLKLKKYKIVKKIDNFILMKV